MDFVLNRYDQIQICYNESENEAVKIAVRSLKRDLYRVLDARFDQTASLVQKKIYVGTSEGLQKQPEWHQEPEKEIKEKLPKKKEAYLILEREGELWIAGADRRGTIYGIYEFCERFLSVSPWHFMADVPVRKKEQVIVPGGTALSDYPEVEYRGIFINDEEELEHWVQRYMGEETIGVKTYAEIFELLLRLKLNYIWPAMHVNSFNLKKENGELANRMGIVVGTSHCDMLMRSNNREWKPWLAGKGYTDVEYDYSIPGRNREILEEYWRESVEQNKEFEVAYTLGMRGIHDSGFHTKNLVGKTGTELLQAKIELLSSVIAAQERILSETLNKETIKTFVPYKEVLELYDNGLSVPEDLTLIWVNDNYGHVRRYPDERAKKRKAGNGIYYHNSYWAPPGASYLFVCSIPLAHTQNELLKAYHEGIQKIWVTNFGALKPLEMQMSFYAKLAWEADRVNAETRDPEHFVKEWIDRTFSGGFGETLAPMLIRFDQVTNARKLEFMDSDVFSQTAYGDEAAVRMHFYEDAFALGNEVYGKLPKEEKDAFYQLVLMRIHAAYFTNGMYYFADRSNLCVKQGKASDAARYAQRSKEFEHARRSMLYYYNHVMANGKWNGILTPEDFPPPRTALYPAMVPPLKIPGDELIVSVWNESMQGERRLCFTRPVTKWIELANAGKGKLSVSIAAPKWILFEWNGEERCGDWALTIAKEERVLVKIDPKRMDDESVGTIRIKAMPQNMNLQEWQNASETEISVLVNEARFEEKNLWEKSASKDGGISDYMEDDGRICREAETGKMTGGFRCIPGLGRHQGALVQTDGTGTATYFFQMLEAAAPILELHRFPSLNSVGAIRIGVSVDGGEPLVLETPSNDEHRGTWKENILNSVDKLTLALPKLAKGLHEITLHAIDPYVAFSRLVLYTKEPAWNSLGIDIIEERLLALPNSFEPMRFAEDFYGSSAARPKPRPVLYLTPDCGRDSLALEDIMCLPEKEEFLPEEQQKVIRDIMEGAGQLLQAKAGRLKIDAACALAQTEFAWTEGAAWDYCSAPSYGENSLALFIREKGKAFGTDGAMAPSAHYRMKLPKGDYRIWARLYFWDRADVKLSICMDENRITQKEMLDGKDIWRYSSEHVWKWVPLCRIMLEEGEHVLTYTALHSGLRVEQFYLTTGEELPPVTQG